MAGSADPTRALSRVPNYFAVNGLRLCNSSPYGGTGGVALPCMFDSSQYAILARCREESYALPEALTS
jgi:hypothetical protein